MYLSLVRPILEYAATVWALYHHTDIYQLEAEQRRAARFVTNCYDCYQSVTDMLRSLEWPILAQRRDHSKIIMMYKIVHNIVHIQPDIPLTYSNAVNTRGYHLKMQQPCSHQNRCLSSFLFPFSSEVVELFTLKLN